MSKKKNNWKDKKAMSFIRMKAVNKVKLASEFVEGQAKLLCTVDTGNLRASINHKVRTKGNEVIGKVGTNVEYAPYIEFGTGEKAENGQGRKGGWFYYDEKKKKLIFTKGNKPQPFLRPAIDTNKNSIKKILGAR
jgi:HK97 gp10 family phage protein